MNRNNKFIKDLISRMTLDQKVGSLLTLGFAGTIPGPHIYDYITKYHCGGLRLSPTTRQFGNYVDPRSGKTVVKVESDTANKNIFKRGVGVPVTTISDYKRVIDEFQRIAMNRPLGIPLHFSFDQEGGSSADFNFGGVKIFPKPMGIRATNDPKLAYDVAKAVSRQSRAVGFSWIHSPVLDINVDPRNPEIYIRAYSDRVEDVITYAEESCRGFKDGKLIACGKHFPGRGDSPLDAHFELPVINVDRDTMLKRELLPYKVLIEKDLLPSIMIAHSIFPAFDPDEVATVSKKIVTGLLRDELGFDGVITTDSMTMGAIATRYGVANACAMALEAGADLVLMKAENQLVDETFNTIKNFVLQGRITEEQLDEKVYRVLNTKYEYGLFHEGNIPKEDPEDVVKDPQICFLSKQVAKKSILVARNRGDVLPLSRNERILFIEQTTKNPNNSSWYNGMLYYSSTKYNRNVSYLETAHTYDDTDKANIRERIKDFDTIVITNFYIRGKLSNNEMVAEVCKSGKKVILVTNTPYRELSIPDEADNVVITFSTGPDSMEATAGVLFGEITPEGVWPVEYKLD